MANARSILWRWRLTLCGLGLTVMIAIVWMSIMDPHGWEPDMSWVAWPVWKTIIVVMGWEGSLPGWVAVPMALLHWGMIGAVADSVIAYRHARRKRAVG